MDYVAMLALVESEVLKDCQVLLEPQGYMDQLDQKVMLGQLDHQVPLVDHLEVQL